MVLLSGQVQVTKFSIQIRLLPTSVTIGVGPQHIFALAYALFILNMSAVVGHFQQRKEIKDINNNVLRDAGQQEQGFWNAEHRFSESRNAFDLNQGNCLRSSRRCVVDGPENP